MITIETVIDNISRTINARNNYVQYTYHPLVSNLMQSLIT
jgi:hypothetical protein